MGGLAIVWGIIVLFMRPGILEFAREGGKGLRNRGVINALVLVAAAFLCIGGAAVVIFRGF